MSAKTAAPRNPPFRAEHIGSLLRPKALLDLRYAVADNKATASDLKPVEEAAIKDAISHLQKLGIHSLTNGEYPRHMFWGTFFETLHGMSEINLAPGGYDQSIFREYAPDVKSFMHAKTIPNSVTIATGRVKHTGTSSFLPEYEFLKSILPEEEWYKIKLTTTSPSWYLFRYKEGGAYAEGVYKNDAEYMADVAAAYRQELDILYKAGLRNIQVDDPNLAYFCDESMIAGWAKDSANTKTVDEAFDAYIRFYNDCFRRPADLHLGIHLCRGNYIGSQHFSTGAYDRIAKKLFQDLEVDTYYLEYDTERAGGFEPLKFLPKHKNVVLGVVTSKFGKLEDVGEMVARVNKAADFIAEGSGETRDQALKRVSVSPQCGFSSHAEGNSISEEEMWKKLGLVRSIADRVWGGEP